MPDFIKAYNANKEKFVVIGVDWNDSPESVKKHVSDNKISFPITIDNTGDIITLFRAKGHPTNIFIDKAGVISAIVPGIVTPQFLDQQLNQLLG